MGAAARAPSPRRPGTQQARATRAGTVAGQRRAAQRRSHHQQHAVVFFYGTRKEVEVFEHLTNIIILYYIL